MESKAITPFWKDKAVYAALLSLSLPVLNKKYGWNLSPGEVIGVIGSLTSMALAHKWKSCAVLLAEIGVAGVQSVKVPDDAEAKQ